MKKNNGKELKWKSKHKKTKKVLKILKEDDKKTSEILK